MLNQLLNYASSQRKWTLLNEVFEFLTIILIGLGTLIAEEYWQKMTISKDLLVMIVMLITIEGIYHTFFRKWLYRRWSKFAKEEINEKYFESILSYDYKNKDNGMKIIQRDLKGIDKLAVIYEQLFPAVLQIVIGLGFFAIISIYFHSWLFLGILSYFFILICGMWLIRKSGTKVNRQHMRLFMGLGERFLSDLNGINTLIMYQQDGIYENSFREDSERFRKSTMALLSYQLRSLFVLGFALSLGLIVVTTILSFEMNRGILSETLGRSLLMMVIYWFLSTRKIGYFIHIVKSTTPILKEIFSKIEKPDISDKKNLEKLESVSLKNVSFSYVEKEIINDISATFVSGTITYLVGPNGSGKSTITELITGELNPNQGEVQWNNSSIIDYSRKSGWDHIGVLTGNSLLFEGSIEENINLPSKKFLDYQQVLKKYHLCSFVEEFPEGFNTQIGVGGRYLSPGQRQQIAFARLFLDNKDLYIFDEIASSVDQKNSEIIKKTIDHLAKNKIVIIISHDLHLIPDSANVIFLSNGKIYADQHQNLIRNNRTYWKFTREVVGRNDSQIAKI